MNEEETKKLIEAELRKTGGVLPRHIHNGIDSPRLKFTELEDITDASYTDKGIVKFLTDAATSGITVASGVANVNYGTGANQIVKLNGSSQLPAVDGSLLTNLPATDYTQHTFTAGQTLTANDAVYVGVPTTETISISSTNNADQSILYEGETFIAHGVEITEISWIYLDNNNKSSELNIYRTSGGFPTGSALFTYSFSTGDTGTYLTQTRTISGNVVTTPGEVLCAVTTKFAGGGGGAGVRTNSSVFAEGNLVTSVDGTTWINETGKELCIVSVKSLSVAVGSVGKANAKYNAQGTLNFVGFCVTSSTGKIATSGILGGFSGLTTGSTYYLTDGWGTIGTSAGTTSKKVGKAVSATELLIINDN
jgi:hypothetical protein